MSILSQRHVLAYELTRRASITSRTWFGWVLAGPLWSKCPWPAVYICCAPIEMTLQGNSRRSRIIECNNMSSFQKKVLWSNTLSHHTWGTATVDSLFCICGNQESRHSGSLGDRKNLIDPSNRWETIRKPFRNSPRNKIRKNWCQNWLESLHAMPPAIASLSLVLNFVLLF